MKTIRKSAILFLGLAALGLSSCSNAAFDKYPSDTMQMENYGKDDSEVLNILLDSYYYLREVSSRVILVNGLATDEAYDFKRNNSQDHIKLNESTWDATLGMTSEIWAYCFNMINRCNTVLERLDNVSEANRTQYEGEAMFFRAYAYFTLVRLYGAVPVSTSVISDYTTLYSYGRTPVDDVYTRIEQDLSQAIADLPETYDYSANPSMRGRATKIAAWTMLADVQMTRGNFSDAKTTLEKVIDYADANPSVLGLESDVADIYDSNNPIGKEIILAAQYNNGSTIVENDLMTRCVPLGVPNEQPAYVYPDGTASSITVAEVGNSTFVMTWALWNKLRESAEDGTDDRLTKLAYAGIYDTQSISNASDEVNVVTLENKDPDSGAVLSTTTHACMPTSLKYFDFACESTGISRSSNDNIIYRYGGVLLMYAECLNETGQSGDRGNAMAYVNLIRERANAEPVSASSQEDIRLAIENENLLELNFEGHRWFNLVRTGRITPVMVEHFAHRTPGLSAIHQADENGMTVTDASATSASAQVHWKWENSSADVLFAIPYDQIQLTNWEQNEIYQ